MELDHTTPASTVRDDDKASFVMSIVKQSDELREDLVDTWEESLANYFVRPYADGTLRGRTDRPLSNLIGDKRSATRLGYSILKDPESHQIVETLLSKIWNSLFGEPGYVRAKGRGVEDAYSGDTASRLLEYDLGLQGHPRTMYEWIKDALIFGTGIIEASWRYEEGPRKFRSIEANQFTGEEQSNFETLLVPLYDDPRIRPINIMDFYPDPGECRLPWMRCAVKRFQITAKEALAKPHWDRQSVMRAINHKAREDADWQEDHVWQDDIKYTEEAQIPHDFGPMIGYEFWGQVPWKTNGDFNDRQVITLLVGEVVEDRVWPLTSTSLPFFDLTINPVEGRFYGLSPLEVAKFDQDFADALKRMIANAVVRGTLAQPIVNANAALQMSRLRRFDPDIPIQVQGDPRTAMTYAEYRPPIEGAQNMYGQVKQQMREGSGALGAIQGHGLGSKRFSATEASGTFEQAFDRPEMIASLIEQDSLPPLGKHLIALNQQFLEMSDDLALRVGEVPGAVRLAEILIDFDLQFTGSRREHNKATRLQSLERFVATVGSIPPIAARIPWDLWMDEYANALDLQKVRQHISAPQTIHDNVLLMLALGQNAQNGNGQPSGSSQALTPAQDQGGILGPGV